MKKIYTQKDFDREFDLPYLSFENRLVRDLRDQSFSWSKIRDIITILRYNPYYDHKGHKSVA